MASDKSFVKFVVEQSENREWLSHLVRITVNELPEPKVKKKKT